MPKKRRVDDERCVNCGRLLIPRPDGSAHHIKYCAASACLKAYADKLQAELDALPKPTGEVSDERTID